MRHYRLGAHTKSDLKVHVVWIPKYRKPVLTLSGKVARDPVHVFLSYRPTQDVSQIMQWLKGISSRVLLQEFRHLRRTFWGRHFWARGYLAVSSGTVTDEMIQAYINEQEGEPIVDDSRFPIDNS